jgi:hypothetical protein
MIVSYRWFMMSIKGEMKVILFLFWAIKCMNEKCGGKGM